MNFRAIIRQLMGCYLALALLMVPLLGLMHGIVHGHSHGLPSTVVSADAQGRAQARVQVQPATVDASGWAKKLFASHDKAADCLVFDQLCHADALHFLPLQALSAPLPNIVLVTLAGDFIARWAALYQARGPPWAR